MASGAYTIANDDTLNSVAYSDPGDGTTQQTVIKPDTLTLPKVGTVAGEAFAIFSLPRTKLGGLRRVERNAPACDSSGRMCDNLITGTSYGKLNRTCDKVQTAVALVQILRYHFVDGIDMHALQLGGNAIWTPDPQNYPGAINVKVHIFAQALHPKSGDDHFCDMAKLFKFDLQMNGCDIVDHKAKAHTDGNLPPGIDPSDLEDLGGPAPEPGRDATYPPTCGGSLIVCDGGCTP